MAGSIFINYRRKPNRAEAQLLQGALQRHFRWRRVFLDLRNLDAGVHWLQELERQVDASAAMVALIGRDWADARDEKGNRRLEDPHDFVRLELARAFNRRIPVLPVLIDGATMPDKALLPPNILDLSFRQAEHLRSETFDHDAERIAGKLRELIRQSRRGGLSYVAAGGAAVAALALGIAAGPRVLRSLDLPFPGVPPLGDGRLGAALDAATADLAKARADLAESQRQLKAAEARQKESDERMRAARDGLDKAKTALDERQGRLDAAFKAREAALAEAGKAKADLQKATREREALRAELDASKRQLDAATRARNEALAEAGKRKAEAEEWQRKYEAAVRKAPPPVPSDPALVVVPGSGKSFRDCPDVCPEMVVVPAGSFTMGSKESPHEQPPHKVTIARPFAVGRFEVTFAEWDACVAEGGCSHRPGYEGWGRDKRPVINVSWNDVVQQYLPWLSRKTGKTYRLLSEAEWEYAARAGTKTPYWWGSSILPSQANSYASGHNKTLPVDSFAPNPWGLYNVHGNVWEWVQDCWHSNYDGAPADGSAWEAEGCAYRVYRGGSWNGTPDILRSSYRYISIDPSSRWRSVGFRVARTL